MYQNPTSQQSNVSANLDKWEKTKRLRMIQEFKESCQITIKQQIEHASASKGRGDDDDLEDPEDDAPLVRGEDGEYNNTRGASS